jgi:hypothetical protein
MNQHILQIRLAPQNPLHMPNSKLNPFSHILTFYDFGLKNDLFMPYTNKKITIERCYFGEKRKDSPHVKTTTGKPDFFSSL